MDIREPEITREQILNLKDDSFTVGNVCLVTGAGTGIGRATAIAAAANGLMAVGLDINEKEGKKTQKMARDLGGQMIFIQTDLCKDDEVAKAVADAAKLGEIKYPCQHRRAAAHRLDRELPHGEVRPDAAADAARALPALQAQPSPT